MILPQRDTMMGAGTILLKSRTSCQFAFVTSRADGESQRPTVVVNYELAKVAG